jgi:hypothetical protein
LKFFTKSEIAPEVPAASLAHGHALKNRCQHWIDELTPEIPILELYAVGGYYAFSPARRAANQVKRLRDIIAQIDSGDKPSNIALLIKSPVLEPFRRDLEHVWETGQTLFPDNLAQVSAWLEAEKEREKQKQAELAVQRRQREKQEAQKKIEDEKRTKLSKLAEETGIPLDTLEKLKKGA